MGRGTTLCSVRHQLNFEYRDNIHEEKLCGPRMYRLDLDGCLRVFQGAAGVEWYLEIERIQEQHRCTEFLNYDFPGRRVPLRQQHIPLQLPLRRERVSWLCRGGATQR